jgi:hypothetical protein
MFIKRAFSRFIKKNYLSVEDLLRIKGKQGSYNVINLYGALMMRGDLDILDEVLNWNFRFFKGIFILDGTEEWQQSNKIVKKYPNIDFYMRDDELGPEYNIPPKDGARQVLLDAIQVKYAFDGYIVILHSDEIFYDFPPSLLAIAMEYYGVDALSIKNVHFFLHSSMKNEYIYNPHKSVIDQLCYACFPGYKELRIFKNKKGLRYDVNRHSQVIPDGLNTWADSSFPLRHYLYRSPKQTIKNISDRSERGWQLYGQSWINKESNLFVDCLPGYKFSKLIPAGKRLLNGETGEFI